MLPDLIDQKWITPKEAQQMLRCSRTHAYREIGDGILKKDNYHGRAMISRNSIEWYLRMFANSG
ncbi:MAG: hypothetical protein CL946_04010 [Ectothiorhodospiraceae bacterium]|nr:hypothetical protein [Ectothiorhodospiraceae bacterium]